MEFPEIFRVVAKWQDNKGYKNLCQSLDNWLTGYRKTNFHFGPSSTVWQTIRSDQYIIERPGLAKPNKHGHMTNMSSPWGFYEIADRMNCWCINTRPAYILVMVANSTHVNRGKLVWTLLISNFLFQAVTCQTSLSLMFKYFANHLKI